MKKVFIDGGAHTGEALQRYVRHRRYLQGCAVYLFEPNPRYRDTLLALENSTQHTVQYRQEAIWKETCEQTFYIATDIWGDLGSTLLPHKREKLDREHPVVVRCIDFSEFLMGNFSRDDFIVVKLDIEGAEFEVIPHLLRTRAIEYIRELFVEWHHAFFSREYLLHTVNIEKMFIDLAREKVKVQLWPF